MTKPYKHDEIKAHLFTSGSGFLLDTEISSRQKFLDLTHKDANLSTIQKLLIKKGKNEGENKKKLKNLGRF